MRSLRWLAVMGVAAMLLARGARAADEPTKPDAARGADSAVQAKVLQAAAPLLVRVQYRLQYDRGDAPKGTEWSQHARNGPGETFINPEQLVREERPLETAGYLVSATQVIAPDITLHPRFIQAISVKIGEHIVDAKVQSYAVDHNAVVLELDKPAEGVSPAVFDAKAAGPFFAVSYEEADGEWVTTVEPWDPKIAVRGAGEKFYSAPDNALITDKSGAPVALSLRSSIAADDSWKGSPLDWPMISAADYAKLLAATQTLADQQVMRVTLNFRSPKAEPTDRFNQQTDNVTIMHVLGVAVDEHTVLVLAELKPKVTSRLERIRVFSPGGAVDASFVATLQDYGALVVKTEKPLALAAEAFLKAAPELAAPRYRDQLLPTGEITLQGEKRVAYYDHHRVTSAIVGWHENVYPQVPGDDQGRFIYDRAGHLVMLPVTLREKTAVSSERYTDTQLLLTCVAQLKDALADPVKHGDPNNVPLSAEQENRLAWLGVELQPLSQELARANNVSDLTNDGQTGALVTYVYPDSPAAKAGIEAGNVLIRVYAEGQPKPIDVKITEGYFSERAFPWDRLGNAPEEVFDQIPTPWPSVENDFIRQLTDLGFGKKVQVEIFHDGKDEMKNMAVTQSPAHWDSAPRYKHAPSGLTVRDMSYEVRRYFQIKNDESGVVISKIEMGSKASVAGLKPYEIITHVNDQPVNTVADFEKLTAGQTELRLNVKRMNHGRIVKITLGAGGAAATQETPAAATAP